jgi:pilus assembly protein CpaB
MLSRRGPILIVVSLLLAVGAAYVANQWLLSKNQEREATPGTVPVAVAAIDIPFGTTIEPRHVAMIQMLEGTAPQGVFPTAAAVEGKVARASIMQGEILLDGRFTEEGEGSTLSSIVAENMRAVSVRVNDVVGVAGFVLPGTRVDVILTGSPTERGGTDTAKVILENVQVLSAGRQTETDGRGTPQDVTVVTLLVTPVDAQRLALATTDGRIQLALRNPTDLERTDPASVSRERLFSQPAQGTPAPAAAAARVRRAPAPRPTPTPQVSVELIQGGKKETVVFNADQDGPQ